MHHGKRETEDGVVGFVIGKQFVEQFGDMAQGDRSRIADLRGHGRFQHLAGIEARELVALADVVKRPHIGKWFESSAEAALRLFGRARYTANLTLRTREERDQQIGLAQWIAAQYDRFRLSQGHGVRG